MNQRARKVRELQKLSKMARISTISSIFEAQSGHPGGSLSVTDILTVLYFYKMKINPKCPQMLQRDRLVLSKGHAAPALYSILALRGFFPKDELLTLRQIGSRLSGHPTCFKTPGVDITTGSLGQGLSIGLGMRLAGEQQRHTFTVWVVLGDGELQEGQVWEAAMAAAHFKAKGLVAIVDYNQVQLDGCINEIMEIKPLHEKWQSFGWKVIEVDGHNIDALIDALDQAQLDSADGPVVVIANTVKGKGVSFMENSADWHGRVISQVEFRSALEELEQGCGGEHDAIS